MSALSLGAQAGDHAHMTGAPPHTRPVRLLTQLDVPVGGARVVAESRALLEAAARGEPETLRLYRVEPCVAFGPADERSPGYERALAISRDAGFEDVGRVEGGRAIAADPGTLGLAWTIPGDDARARIRPRFSFLAAVLAEALRTLEVDARVGAVRGEYCAGDFSVNARDQVKLAGLGQRVTARGAHIGASIVVDGATRLRGVLTGVYDALGLDWEPASMGSVATEVGGLDVDTVARAVIEVLGRHLDLQPATAQQALRGGA